MAQIEVEVALAALMGFHQQLGVAIEPKLFLPGASESDIQAVESEIGFRLPEDLRELYKIANGQLDPYDNKEDVLKLLEPNQAWAPLFGYYQFLPLDKALVQYEFYLDIYTSEKEFNEKYMAANPGSDGTLYEQEVRVGDPVDPFGWNTNWFIFAQSNADSYAIDMTPPPGGTIGQVVEFGADVTGLSVVATSVTDLMQQAVLQLDPNEENRYERSESERGYPATVYFDMDWRNKPYNESDYTSQVPAEYEAWLEQQDNHSDQRQSKLKVWLIEQGLSEQDSAELGMWSQSRLDFGAQMAPPKSVLNALAAFKEEWQSLLNSAEAESDSVSNLQQYFAKLSGTVLDSKNENNTISSTQGEGLKISEAIDLLHRYRRDTQIWTNEEYQWVENVRAQLEQIEVVDNDGFRFITTKMNETSLTICQSKIDENTYQPTDVCSTVNTEYSQ